MQQIGKVLQAELIQEMQTSYINYAMSVIVSRALPDVRDGLKPVHRRILYSMQQMGLLPPASYSKSAKVVGETMGKFHPHGDQAIYDALVRLAQPFSMRYPIVDGQGNFGCFTKDTKVKLTDGRDLTFGELVKEDKKGKKNYTYTINKLGLISITQIKNPRLTIKNTEIIKVTLDNGQEIKCTPNHLFMLKDGAYKEARDLTPQDSLMPLYHKLSKEIDKINREGYVLIFQPKTKDWVPTYHLADNYNLSLGRYKKSAGRVRHHINFNKLDNNPDNIIRMQWYEHWQIHYKNAIQNHQDPEYRKKISLGRKKYWSDPQVKSKYSTRMSETNLKNWQDPTYSEKMRAFLSEVNIRYIETHPEKRKEFSKRMHKTLTRLWKNPEYRALMHEKIIKGNKNHTTNKTGKLKFLNICKQAVNQYSALSKEYYEQTRTKLYPYGKAPLWETGLKNYFSDNPDLIRLEINGNHKIVEIEPLTYKEDVYDLTIDGTHNFALASGVFVHNSVDGDSAAAMRYTEVRLGKIAEELLRDIEKDTVNFQDNFDASIQEPVYLPAILPNLLLMGSEGIAVGMATKIPPHNLTEIIDAVLATMKKGKVTELKPEADDVEAEKADGPERSRKEKFSIKKIDLAVAQGKKTEELNLKAPEVGFDSEITTEELMKHVLGPDFPTGGAIYGGKFLPEMYGSGRGKVVVRGIAKIEEAEKGKSRISITELPYQVNKALLVARIAQLVRDKKLIGISDIRDESDKRGMTVVIELKKDARPKSVLNNLYKHTSLQTSFPANFVALVDGTPRTLTLKQILIEYIKHRQRVITRRSIYDLTELKRRAHILEGYKIALDNLDEVIKTIRASKDTETAKSNLIKKFGFTEIQAVAILDMQLRRLSALEREKIEEEYKKIGEQIAYLTDLLEHPVKIFGVIENELKVIKEKYGDERRTKVYLNPVGEISEEDLIAREEVIVTVTKTGYIKRVPRATYKAQARGGKGVMGMTTKEEDEIAHLIAASTHDNLMFFTNKGRVFGLKTWEIGESSRQAKGQAIVNLINIDQGEEIQAILTQDDPQAKFFIVATQHGTIKKTAVNQFQNIRSSGLTAIKLDKGDRLTWVRPSSGEDNVLMVSRKGKSIRFSEKDVRPMGRPTMGVRGILLGVGDEVIGMEVLPSKETVVTDKRRKTFKDILVIMEKGIGKRTPISGFPVQKRGGQGVKVAEITDKTGEVAAALLVTEEVEQVLITSRSAQVIRLPIKNIPQLGRATQGVILMRFGKDKGDRVAAVATLDKEETGETETPDLSD